MLQKREASNQIQQKPEYWSSSDVVQVRNYNLESDDDLEPAEDIIFRPLFQFRQEEAQRRTRYNEYQNRRISSYRRKNSYRYNSQRQNYRNDYYNNAYRSQYPYSNEDYN